MDLKNRIFHTILPAAVIVFIGFLGLLQSGLAFQSVPDQTRPRPEKVVNPVLIEFKGPIDRKLTMYFNNRFETAKQSGADLLIIEIDSPGGLKIESLQMARLLRDCKWAYTVAIINNEAISGGALVSLGCDEIHIDPNAKLGDIGEIAFDPQEMAFRLVEPKIESYLSRDARDLAESKGRSADLAESFVDKDVLVYSQPDPENEGKLLFRSVRSDAIVKPEPPWELIQESGPERFLTVSGQRAVELTLAQGFESSREKAAQSFGFPLDSLRVYRPTTTDSLVYYLNHPVATFLLVLIGLIALYFELTAPGIGVGGLIAGLCAVLFFWSRFLGGTGGWLEVILFVAGIVFIAMEVFVIPGFGVSGLTGIILLFVSIVLAGQDFVIPQTGVQWNQTMSSTLLLLGSTFGFLIAAVLITTYAGSIPGLKRLILSPREIAEESDGIEKDEHGKPIAKPHPEISVGDWGLADSLLRPAGRAKFGNRSFDVISDGNFIDPGTQVTVISIRGNVITVAAVEDENQDDENV